MLEISYLSAGFDIPLTLAILTGITAFYALYLTFRPLFADVQINAKEWNKIEDDSMALLARRDRVIEELKDLEFEAAMTKVEGKDLEELRLKYEAEALLLIEELDAKAEVYKTQIQTEVQKALLEMKERRNKAQVADVKPEPIPESIPEPIPEPTQQAQQIPQNHKAKNNKSKPRRK